MEANCLRITSSLYKFERLIDISSLPLEGGRKDGDELINDDDEDETAGRELSSTSSSSISSDGVGGSAAIALSF